MIPPRSRCSATTRQGRPCRRWATRHSDPPLCPVHLGRTSRGENRIGRDFSLPADLPEELHHLPGQTNLTLDQEIGLARHCLQRVAEALKANGELTPDQRIRLAALIFRGTSTIARLLRERLAVSGEPGDGLASILDEVVRQVAAKLGVEP